MLRSPQEFYLNYPPRSDEAPSYSLERRAFILGVAALVAGNLIEHNLMKAGIYAAEAARLSFDGTQLGIVTEVESQRLDAAEAQRNTPTTIKIYVDKEHPVPTGSDVTHFIFTGLGEVHGDDIAASVAKATSYKQPIRYEECGTEAITIDGMCDQLIKSLEEQPLDTPAIGFTLHSMAGIMLPLMLKRLKERNHELPPIAFVNFLSAPSGMQTARFGQVAEFMVKSGYNSGPKVIAVPSFFREWWEQRFNPEYIRQDLVETLEGLTSGGSEKLIESQSDILALIYSRGQLMSLMSNIKQLFSPYTKFTYFGPHLSSTDHVVNDNAAHDDWTHVIRQALGNKLSYFGWGQGHASYNFDRKSGRALRLASTPSRKFVKKYPLIIDRAA